MIKHWRDVVVILALVGWACFHQGGLLNRHEWASEYMKQEFGNRAPNGGCSMFYGDQKHQACIDLCLKHGDTRILWKKTL